jgi:hypothetical protein
MKKRFCVLPVAVIFLSLTSASFAQGLTLKDRSVLELNLGIWGGASVSNTIGISGIQSNAKTSSFGGSILYAYGIQENMSVTLAPAFSRPELVRTSVCRVSVRSPEALPLCCLVLAATFHCRK